MLARADAWSFKLPGSSVVFAQMEAGPYQRGFTSGFKWSPFGPLDQPGFRVLSKAYSGTSSTPGPTLYKREAGSDGYVLVGLEGSTPQGHVGLYLGADTFRRIDYIWGKAFRETQASGLRIQIEMISRPYADWVLTTKAAISTGTRELWTQAQLTHPLPGPVWQGPRELVVDLSKLQIGVETELTLRDGYGKRRFGLAVNEIRIGRFGLALSGGLQSEDDRKASAYGRLTLLWQQ